jgi:phage shock protein PspC (stress-responsive transcriptional regulator)
MKHVETIQINGIVFSIDDDAFEKLGSYLEKLSNYFKNELGGREIIVDIEARISELFAERDEGVNKVITTEDVVKVIETLGTPEDIAGTDADAERKTTPPCPSQTVKRSKRLLRDGDRGYAGGVCAGLAAWLGIGALAVRLAFIFLTIAWGASIGVYILLWIIIPKAKTTAQKLEMRGEPVNINNIEKNIRENLSDSTLRQSIQTFIEEAGEIFGKIFRFIGRIIAIVLGFILCCCGICFAILLIGIFFMQDIVFNKFVEWDFLSFTEIVPYFTSPASYTLLIICSILISSLLIFALLFWGVKLIAGFKVKRKLLHVSLFVLWFVAIVTGLVVCLAEARNYTWSSDQIVETRPVIAADTLYLVAKPSPRSISNNPMDIYFDRDNQRFYGKPNLNIRKSDDGQIKLHLNRESQGESKRAAYQYAENITYNVEIVDSLLTFDPYFTVTPPNRYKFQNLGMILYIPEGTVIIADETLCNDRYLGRMFRWRHQDSSKWIMTESKGLQPIE